MALEEMLVRAASILHHGESSTLIFLLSPKEMQPWIVDLAS